MTQKIPVKIVQTKDIHGTKKIGVMLDVEYYIESEGNPGAKVKKFKQLYFDTLEKGKKFIPTHGTKRRTTEFWKLGKLLSKLKKSTNDEFFITNYYTALQRDFLFTSKYLRMILEFGQYFKKNEVLNLIKFSHYMELIQKRKNLEKLNQFEKEKKRLLKMGKSRTLPGLMKYREQLKELVETGRRK